MTSIMNGDDFLMTYDELLIEADKNNLIAKEKPLVSGDGRISGNRIAIRKSIETQAQKACVLAEELGHHYTTVGNILDQNNVSNRRQEQKARTWAYFRQISLCDLVSAYRYGCRNKFEIAEYLGITEQFLTDALQRFKEKYGLFKTCDTYVIYFDPLSVFELYNN